MFLAATTLVSAAGIGRSGTFCTIDIILKSLEKAENKEAAERAVDVKKVVSLLRRQRVGMVQTPAQYNFCHQVSSSNISGFLTFIKVHPSCSILRGIRLAFKVSFTESTSQNVQASFWPLVSFFFETIWNCSMDTISLRMLINGLALLAPLHEWIASMEMGRVRHNLYYYAFLVE